MMALEGVVVARPLKEVVLLRLWEARAEELVRHYFSRVEVVVQYLVKMEGEEQEHLCLDLVEVAVPVLLMVAEAVLRIVFDQSVVAGHGRLDQEYHLLLLWVDEVVEVDRG